MHVAGNDEVGRDADYAPLMAAAGDSFHRGAANTLDDDDAPPHLEIHMGDMEGGHIRGGFTLRNGLLWPNEKDFDKFLTRLYRYYVGKGLFTIILAKLFNLFILAFIVGFTTFLAGCIDYSILFTEYDLHKAVSISRLALLNPFLIMCLVVFVLFWLWHLFFVIWEIRPLLEMHTFFSAVLGISDRDLPTTRWTDVVTRLLEVQPEDDEARRLTHHDVANIIMRRDNYMIAMFNQDIIRLRINICGAWETPELLTQALEWNINTCIMDYIFDDTTIRKKFTQPENHDELVRLLRRRFFIWAILNLIFMPFIVIFLVMFFIFRYGEEVHRDPGSLSARQYTPIARMRFREFNEYPHLFDRRLNASYEKARDYMQLFPFENWALLARLVAFISGAFAVVLLVLSFIDEDILLKLELIPGHNTLWFLGVFSAIFAMARAFIPAETLVFQPERLMRQVIEGTHYYPPHWQKQLHTDLVRRQFARLFDYKGVVFLVEIVGVVLVPLVMLFTLPSCADEIIDFVAKYTVKRDKIGLVCSYALFDLKRHGNPMYGAPADVRDPKGVSRNGKMEKSFLNFKANNPDWQPDEAGMEYLNKLSRFQQLQQGTASQHPETTAQDMAESAMFSSSILFTSMHSAPSRTRAAAKGKAPAGLGESTLSEGAAATPARPRPAGAAMQHSAVSDSMVTSSMYASGMGDGMMSLLESVYDADSGMV